MWSMIILRMMCFQNNFHFRHSEGHKIVTLFSCKSWRFFCHLPYLNVFLTLMWSKIWFLIFLSHFHVKYHCSLLNFVSFLLAPSNLLVFFKVLLIHMKYHCSLSNLIYFVGFFQSCALLFLGSTIPLLWSLGDMFLVWKVT
jgi:hypothetical protein